MYKNTLSFGEWLHLSKIQLFFGNFNTFLSLIHPSHRWQPSATKGWRFVPSNEAPAWHHPEVHFTKTNGACQPQRPVEEGDECVPRCGQNSGTEPLSTLGIRNGVVSPDSSAVTPSITLDTPEGCDKRAVITNQNRAEEKALWDFFFSN